MGGRGLITRALGVEPGLEVDVQEQAVAAGDLYLLCTDGLFDMIPDEEIAAILSDTQGEVEAAAKALVAAANTAGGYDNISVIIVGIR
jgi:protein phosphatase